MNTYETYARIHSQYYLFDSKNNPFKTEADAWDKLVKYVKGIYTNSDNETIIIDEARKAIKVVTKNKTLAMDRYVPIKPPVDIKNLDNNLKQVGE